MCVSHFFGSISMTSEGREALNSKWELGSRRFTTSVCILAKLVIINTICNNNNGALFSPLDYFLYFGLM